MSRTNSSTEVRALGLAALSGGLSYQACLLFDGEGTKWGAGVLFGLLVLGPSARERRRFLSLASLSTLVYRGAVELASQLHTEHDWPALLACALAGFAGAALLAVGSDLLQRQPQNPRRLVHGGLAGAASGSLIGLAFSLPDESPWLKLSLALGFLAWQTSYTAIHHLRPFAAAPAEPA